jgi:uncharacterized protein YbbC (DUF1343 family)
MTIKIIVGLFLSLALSALPLKRTENPGFPAELKKDLHTGAERMNVYLPMLKGKKVGLTINHTAIVGETHLLDTLLQLGVNVQRVFVPEHGLRGTADAGEKIQDGKDPKTGVAMSSLYGSRRKPSPEDLAGLDLMIFDIQDVGVRFYTYISTLHYVMEACAEQGLPLMVLDRPNPNGHFVDGPILDTAYRSFVGMHPIPVVHGMTVGEYAQMVNGQGWLKGGASCKLQVIKCEGYTHDTPYSLPRKPSPNLPNMRSIYLYPSICYFEGTQVSVGRGTDKQFQVLGTPDFPLGDYTFTPEPKEGAMQPFLQGKLCRGYDLTSMDPDEIRNWRKIHLEYLINFYKNYPDKENFFLKGLFIDKLAGGKSLRTQIIEGWDEDKIRASWEPGLSQYKVMRKQYLLYKD